MKVKVKKETKVTKKKFFDTKEKKIGFGAAAAVVLLLMIVLMVIESSAKTQLIIHNNTDINLEYVKTKYVYPEGDITDTLETKAINANNSLTVKTDEANLTNFNANYNISFKFENNKEMSVDAGLFNGNFSGTITVKFKKTDDPNVLEMTVKAKEGFFKTNVNTCDDVFTVDLANGTAFDKQ